MKKIRHWYFYLFFSAYWTAYYMGEKDEPEGNADYLVTFILVLILLSARNIIQNLGIYKIPLLGTIIVCAILPMIFNYSIFLNNKKYRKELPNYEFLKLPEYRKKRFYTLIISILIPASLMMFSMTI